jgi:uncharacterized protein YdeI (YjbR/CyaY-like superfamily)
MKPTFFKSQEEFRSWLDKNHDQVPALWVGLQKTGSSQKGLNYKQALDEALCFGWIDGVRKSIDESRWTIRFTPRKPRSIWSAVNIKRVGELKALGLMKPSGLKQFEERDEKRAKLYSFENAPVELDAAYEKQFKANKKAWEFFQSQAPYYQRTARFWVMSAKKEETRLKRLSILIESSAKGSRAPHLIPSSQKKGK